MEWTWKSKTKSQVRVNWDLADATAAGFRFAPMHRSVSLKKLFSCILEYSSKAFIHPSYIIMVNTEVTCQTQQLGVLGSRKLFRLECNLTGVNL